MPVTANSAPRHGAVLLAAGASRRLGRPKQLIEIDGEALVRRAARALLATAPVDCVVVLGHAAADFAKTLDGLPLRCVIAADFDEGLAASLRVGIAALDARCAGALVALTDQPALHADHLRALRDTWRQAPTRAAASAYAGTLGVPALLPRTWFADVATLVGDVGARDMLRSRARDVTAVAADALVFDIDTPSDVFRERRDEGGAR